FPTGFRRQQQHDTSSQEQPRFSCVENEQEQAGSIRHSISFQGCVSRLHRSLRRGVR
ncbi:unnamed protein product, partial [Ascophyllum nodosum]